MTTFVACVGLLGWMLAGAQWLIRTSDQRWRERDDRYWSQAERRSRMSHPSTVRRIEVRGDDERTIDH